MKLEIPKFRYLAQDESGFISLYSAKPNIGEDMWFGDDCALYHFHVTVKPNPNWRETLIDLEVDDYDFSDGILRRVDIIERTLKELGYRYAAQDQSGFIGAYYYKPFILVQDMGWYPSRQSCAEPIDTEETQPNPNWEKSLIDIRKDSYIFKDGILNKVDK